MEDVLQLIMNFANKGISIDYTIIDQRANGTYDKILRDKTYTVTVKEINSGNEIAYDILYLNLVEAMRYGINVAYESCREAKNARLSSDDKKLFEDIMNITNEGVAIDYTVVRTKSGTIRYGIMLSKIWSFGEQIHLEVFDDLADGMKNGIEIAREYLRLEKQHDVNGGINNVVDEW